MDISVIGLLAGLASLAFVLMGGDAVDQGRGAGARVAGHYSVAAESTVNGSVEDVKPGPGRGTRVMLKTADGTSERALIDDATKVVDAVSGHLWRHRRIPISPMSSSLSCTRHRRPRHGTGDTPQR